MRILLVTRSFVVRDGGEILIIKRVLTERHNPGLWECPGGKVEEQDIWISRIREVYEETGLIVELSSSVSYVDTKNIVDGIYAGALCLRIFGIMRVVSGNVRLNPLEHDEFAWVSINDIHSYELTHEVRRAIIALREHIK